MSKMLKELPRVIRSLATQLRTGHFPTTKLYRYRFKLIHSPKWRTCGADDSILHRIFICRRHIMARITLRRKITKINNIRFRSNAQECASPIIPLRVLQTAIDYVSKKLRWLEVTENIRGTQIIETFLRHQSRNASRKIDTPFKSSCYKKYWWMQFNFKPSQDNR